MPNYVILFIQKEILCLKNLNTDKLHGSTLFLLLYNKDKTFKNLIHQYFQGKNALDFTIKYQYIS